VTYTDFVHHKHTTLGATMANVTITADDEVLQRARIEAARRNLSLSRFLGELLKEKFSEDDAYDRAMADFFARGPYLDPPVREDGRRWPAREELYDRQVLK
jgi:hypothetical protein